MAKGTESKNRVFGKIQEVFPDSFWEDEGKILRIPLNENGSRVEIKVSLTAAKTNLGGDEVKGAFPYEKMELPENTMNAPIEPSEEEKANVQKLLESLGL